MKSTGFSDTSQKKKKWHHFLTTWMFKWFVTIQRAFETYSGVNSQQVTFIQQIKKLK